MIQMATRASIREKKAANREKQTQQDILLELKKKQRAIREKRVMNPDDLYHGALEDILLGSYINGVLFSTTHTVCLPEFIMNEPVGNVSFMSKTV